MSVVTAGYVKGLFVLLVVGVINCYKDLVMI